MSRKQRGRSKLERIRKRGFNILFIEMSESYLDEFPNVTTIWIERGIALTCASRYDDALQAFERALELGPSQLLPIVWREKGDLYQRRGDFSTAIECYAKAVGIEPEEGYWWSLVAEMQLLSGDLEHAEKTLRTALTFNCKESDYIHNMPGRVLTSLERYEEAKQSYQRALDLFPDFAHAFERLHELQMAQSTSANVNIEEEISYGTLKNYPHLFLSHFYPPSHELETDTSRWISCGQALGALCRYDDSREVFQTARLQEFDEEGLVAFAWYREAIMEEQHGDYERCQQCCEHAIEILPDSTYCKVLLAKTLIRRGQIADAEKVLRETEYEDDVYSQILFHLGRVLLIQRNYQEAAQCYREAIEINPDYKSAKVRLLDAELTMRWRQKNNF